MLYLVNQTRVEVFMIHGRIEELSRYIEDIPGAAVIEEFIAKCFLEDVPPGKYEINDEIIFISVDEYEIFAGEDKRLEAHEVYADSQCIISGHEKIGYGQFTEMEPVTEYDPLRDIAFYSGSGDFQEMKAGDFMILLPGETHKPCVTDGDKPSAVKKAVVKIKGDLFIST